MCKLKILDNHLKNRNRVCKLVEGQTELLWGEFKRKQKGGGEKRNPEKVNR